MVCEIMTFFCFLSLTIGWTLLGVALAVFIICGAMAFFIINSALKETAEKRRQEDEKRKQEDEEKRKQKALETEQRTLAYNAAKNELISKYGQPDKTIIFENLNLDKEIVAFGEANRVWILGRDLSMGDILSCSFNDDQQIEKGNISYETKTNTGNMAKRAIVGGVLTGGVGAAIGGATATKETTVKQANDKVIHDYTVIININSLSEPIIRIPLGADGAKANEIVGLMNVIISRKNNN